MWGYCGEGGNTVGNEWRCEGGDIVGECRGYCNGGILWPWVRRRGDTVGEEKWYCGWRLGVRWESEGDYVGESKGWDTDGGEG